MFAKWAKTVNSCASNPAASLAGGAAATCCVASVRTAAAMTAWAGFESIGHAPHLQGTGCLQIASPRNGRSCSDLLSGWEGYHAVTASSPSAKTARRLRPGNLPPSKCSCRLAPKSFEHHRLGSEVHTPRKSQNPATARRAMLHGRHVPRRPHATSSVMAPFVAMHFRAPVAGFGEVTSGNALQNYPQRCAAATVWFICISAVDNWLGAGL